MIITKTPLRISFFGGGSDLPEYFGRHGGAVLGTSIDKYVYLSVTRFPSKLFDYNIRVAYRKVECVGSLEQIEHSPVREALRLCGIERDIEISVAADLPSFSGLGSSSSFSVGPWNGISCARRSATRTRSSQPMADSITWSSREPTGSMSSASRPRGSAWRNSIAA